MITVRGTKESEAAVNPAAPYHPEPEKKNRGVMKVGAALLAAAVYVKFFLTGRVEAATETEADKPRTEGDGDARPRLEALSGGIDGAPHAPRNAADHGGGSDSFAFDVVRSADTIAFAIGSERAVASPMFKPSGYIANSANDNIPLGGGGSAGVAGSLGGMRLPGSQKAATPVAGRPSGGAEGDGDNSEGAGGPDGSEVGGPPGTDPDIDGPGDSDTVPEAEPGEDDEDDDDGETANRAPRLSGPVVLADVSGCAVLTIALADFLRGAVDADGDVLAVEALDASAGSLTRVSEDVWEFSPEGLLGPVSITYRVSDGELDVAQELRFSVVSQRGITGTEGDDILVGTASGEFIGAGAGDDIVDAGAGYDIVCGDVGDDHMVGGAGDDTIWGGAGNDVIFGGAGNDRIKGGAGNDRLFGEAGDDLISGGEGDDRLSGGDGNDAIAGDVGNDILVGEAGDDVLDGGAGDDHVSGGLGDDRVSGGAGNDVLFGDAGDDVIDGGSGDDLIVAGDGANLVRGGAGADRISGGAGGDLLYGEAGDDVLLGEAGDDLLDGGAGDDVLRDGAGSDSVDGDDGDDNVIASADGSDDNFDGAAGCDVLDYSAASEAIEVDLEAGTASGIDIGNDTILGFERLVAGSGNDRIRLGGENISVRGGSGDDVYEIACGAGTEGVMMLKRFEIEDFEVGDRVKMSGWEILEEAFDAFEGTFERIYGDDSEDRGIPIRFRNEWSENVSETVIEADLNGDSFFETMIVLDGRHMLVLTETA